MSPDYVNKEQDHINDVAAEICEILKRNGLKIIPHCQFNLQTRVYDPVLFIAANGASPSLGFDALPPKDNSQ